MHNYGLYPPLQDKWEELISQDPHLEIFEHISLMVLDSIMKYTFSHLGTVQTDKSMTKGKCVLTNNHDIH